MSTSHARVRSISTKGNIWNHCSACAYDTSLNDAHLWLTEIFFALLTSSAKPSRFPWEWPTIFLQNRNAPTFSRSLAALTITGNNPGVSTPDMAFTSLTNLSIVALPLATSVCLHWLAIYNGCTPGWFLPAWQRSISRKSWVTCCCHLQRTWSEKWSLPGWELDGSISRQEVASTKYRRCCIDDFP